MSDDGAYDDEGAPAPAQPKPAHINAVAAAVRASHSIMQRCYRYEHVSAGGETCLGVAANCNARFHVQIDNGFFYMADTENFVPENRDESMVTFLPN